MGTAERSRTAKQLADQVRADGQPRKEEYALYDNNGGVRTPVLKDAVRAAGRDPRSPGRAEQYWFEDQDMLVIDLQHDG